MLHGHELSCAIRTVGDGFFYGFNRPVALFAVFISGALLLAGGSNSIRDVMAISALPISGLTTLPALSLVYVLVVEARREPQPPVEHRNAGYDAADTAALQSKVRIND